MIILNSIATLTIFFFLSNIVYCNPIYLSHKKLNISLPDHYVEEVIITRKDKHIAGVTDDHYLFFFKNGINKEASDFLKKNFPEEEGKAPLIIVVHELITVSTGQICYTDISLSFCQNQSGELIELLRTGTIQHHNWSVFSGHSEELEESITKSFRHCFNDFLYRHSQHSLNERINNHITLERPTINKTNFPILKNIPKRGVIHTFSSFIDNRIDTTIQFSIISKRETQFNSLLASIHITGKKEFWGICDGKNYYRKIGNRYFPIQINDDTIFIHSDVHINRYTNGIGEEIGGLIGYIEIGGDGDGHITRRVRKEIMNLYTGRIMSLKNEIIVNSYLEKKQPGICIIENSEKTICLDRNQYVRYPFSPYDLIISFQIISDTLKRTCYVNTQLVNRVVLSRTRKKVHYGIFENEPWPVFFKRNEEVFY